MSHIQKSKLVYSAYRDMLRNYNDRANEILDSKPASALTEDRGVSDRIHTIITHQQEACGGPPPPPPPPPPPGQAAPMRLKTEIPAMRAEPPACVQNAMMTKDKKPFTYTPGGLDLSQIRSPRMARRLTRNANSEGVEAAHLPQHQQPPPPVQQQQQPQPVVQAVAAAPIPPPPPPSAPAMNRPHVVIPPPPATMPPMTPGSGSCPGSGSGSGSGSLKSAQVGSLYVPPLDSPVTLNRAPTPWLTRNSQPQAEQQSPPWVTARDQPPPQQATPIYSPVQPPAPRPAAPATRVIPVQIQMTAQPPQSYQSPPQPQPYQSPPQPQPYQSPPQPQLYQSPPQPQMYIPPPPPPQVNQQHPQGPVTRIIPIQLETDSNDGPPVQSPAFRMLQKMTSAEETGDRMRRLQLSEDDRTLMNKLRAQVDEENFLHNEVDPRYRGAAIPSRAFRILQHMTDTDGPVQGEPVRQEAVRQAQPRGARCELPPNEPRMYQGGAIPSRSFQMLQAMVEPNTCAQASETDTESSESYQVEPWYYPPPGYWMPDPYWGYYAQPPPTDMHAQTAALMPYYDYGYYHPYYYPYAYDPYSSYESEQEASIPDPQHTDAETVVTETEDEAPSESIALQAIPSVTDIHTVYDSGQTDEPATPSVQPPPTDTSSSTSEEEDDDEEETDEEREVVQTASEDHVPHQLSIIFEESEAALSDTTDRRRETSVLSEDDSSTTIAVESADEEETVTVRLPLRFKFSRTENDEDVTTVIVGDSQVDKCNNVSVTVSIPPSGATRSSSTAALSHHSSESSDSEDGETNASATVTLPSVLKTSAPDPEKTVRVSVRDRILAIERAAQEPLVLDEPTVKQQVVMEQKPQVQEIDDVEIEEEEDDDGEEEEEEEEEEMEEEEEADSGVTSQTDTESECFQEVRRLNKYQRAATHSRLFRLLHALEDGEEEEELESESQRLRAVRQQLSLPLVACSRSSMPESFSSSGIASPASTPPRRPRSELSTPADTWSDYASYYSSWEGGGLVLHPPARASPFTTVGNGPPPRCPMTPAPAHVAGGVS